LRIGAAASAGGGENDSYASAFLVVLSDYGLSKGSYAGTSVAMHNVDPKLFLILDYPVPLANYTGDDDDQSGKWDKYFVENPEKWQQDWGGSGEDWRQYQSLRHFGMANVLFCDGHVELLSPKDLLPMDGRWRYVGR
jgi:prepilin-type processing-associated H-X9-DG protein